MQTNPSPSLIHPSSASIRLNSWKEIAAFFDKDVRTVRRWEVERKMPVYRVPGGSRSGVYAYVGELESWLRKDVAPPSETSLASERKIPLLQLVPHVTPQLPDPVDLPQMLHAAELNTAKVRHWTSVRLFVMLGVAFCLVVWFLRMHYVPSGTSRNFTPDGATHDRKSSEAQDLYLRGRYFWNLRTEEGLKQALELFSQAADRDPRFAAAYAGIADSYILIRQYGHMPDAEAFPRALEASRKALELDADSFEAHRSYAFILNYWLWNFHDAEGEFLKILATHPDDALTHHWYATSLYSAGRFKDALEQIEIARRLQPESIAILTNRDLLLAQLDQQAAFTDLQQLAQANPFFPPIHGYLADIYLARGDLKRYLDESSLAASLSGDAQRVEIAHNAERELASRGPKATLMSLADSYGDLADRKFPDAMTPAFLYARLGEKQRSLHYLTLACHRHESTFLRVGYDKSFDVLNSEAKFQELVKRRNTAISNEGDGARASPCSASGELEQGSLGLIAAKK